MYGRETHHEDAIHRLLRKAHTTHDNSKIEEGQFTELYLFCRCLASLVQKQPRYSHQHAHPLELEPVCRLVGHGSTPTNVAFSFIENVRIPQEVLGVLGVDVFADARYDADILFEIAGRLELNSWADEQDLPDGSTLTILGVNSCYSLLNYSCLPNVSCARDPVTGNMVVKALRDIKAGEELYVSYLDLESLEEGPEERERMLKVWMGDSAHFCERCYPDQQKKQTSHHTGKRRGISDDSESTTPRSSKKARLTRGSTGTSDVFEALPLDTNPTRISRAASSIKQDV